MKPIQKIYSTLQTWVFKKKLLKFSSRFSRDPQACFYCPEMCRFSCPVADNLKKDSVTPRGKMSLLHLKEKGLRFEQITGDKENYQWFLDQCTGCGKCTEYCKHEVDVGENLRSAREVFRKGALSLEKQKKLEHALGLFESLEDVVFICEKNRRDWWLENKSLLKSIDDHLKANQMIEVENLARYWEEGLLDDAILNRIATSLQKCRRIWVESPEMAYFLVKGVKEKTGILKAEVKILWQRHFADFASREPWADEVFHESYYLSRLLPRLGFSIPMYERGFLPFHSGWNMNDCGGESFYTHAYADDAQSMGKRFLDYVSSDGRTVKKIICQNFSCVEHLKKETNVPVTYWLDELVNPESSSADFFRPEPKVK